MPTKHLTLLLFIGLAFWFCEEDIKYEEQIITVYDNGKRKNVVISKIVNGKKKMYKKRKYYENGQIQLETEVNDYGRENGSFVQYDESGTITVSGFYTIVGGESVKNGNWTWWKETGQVDYVEKYLNGVKQN